MATDEDASRAGFGRADVGDCDISGLTPSDPEVYTKPQMRDRIKAEIYCSDKGGDPGEWSARKAQLTVQRYEAEGGGYKNEREFEGSQESLMIWTEQEWQTEDGTPSLPEGDRYLPKGFWNTLSEEEKKKVNETKKEGTKEGKQFVSLPGEISEKFAKWREENRDKFLEQARENPDPQRELRERAQARTAHEIVKGYVESWAPWREPFKVEPAEFRKGQRAFNVLQADATLMGFDEELRPLHFVFHAETQVGGQGVYREDGTSRLMGRAGEEPVLFLRFFGPGWPQELRVVDEEDLSDGDFLREHGPDPLIPGGVGVPRLRVTYDAVSEALNFADPPHPARLPGLGLGAGDTAPSDIPRDEFVDRLAKYVRHGAFTGYQSSDPDTKEEVLRRAISNLEAAKRQILHSLRQIRSTFIHEFQHHIDRTKFDGDVAGSSRFIEYGIIPTDAYYNVAQEVNARYQEGLNTFEEVVLSDPSDLRRRMENGFDARSMFRLLERYTPKFEKLSEENQRRLYKRWFRYWKEVVEPRLDRLSRTDGDETSGGMPEDLRALLNGAERLAEAQNRYFNLIEEAPGPLERTMSTDEKIDALDEKIREGIAALREKAEERGYDFDTIAKRTGLEPMRENPNENDPLSREIERGPNRGKTHREVIIENVKEKYATTDEPARGMLLPDGTLVPVGENGNPPEHSEILPDRKTIPGDLYETLEEMEGDEFARSLALGLSGAARITIGSVMGVSDVGHGFDFDREPTADQEEWIRETIIQSAPDTIRFSLTKHPDFFEPFGPDMERKRLTFEGDDPIRRMLREVRGFYSGEEGATSKVAQMRRRLRRLNPDDPDSVDEFTSKVLEDHFEMTAQIDLHRRPNPNGEYTKERYPGVFKDFDQDNIPTVDDPHPLTPGDETTVEEVQLSEEVENLIDFRKRRAETTGEAEERLRQFLPGDATIKARTKTPYSILNKLRRKRLEGPKGITDVSGGMAILRDYEDLQEARRLIEEDEVLGEVREVENHYELPGPYRAVHYIVEIDGNPVEVQLKTQRLATLASAGHAPYKRGVQDTDEMDRLAGLADRADRGDEEAAEEVDPILSDPESLRERLTLEGARDNPPAKATVDVPGGPTYTVEPGDIILREGASHEDLSREKIAAPPEKARELAQKARKWKEKGAPGMHETGLRRMLQIGAGYQLSPAEMKVVQNWFARKKSERDKGYHEMEEWDGPGGKRPSESLLSWWGWGGEPMMEWVDAKLGEMPDRVRLTDEAFEARENPMLEARTDTGGIPEVVDAVFADVVTEVIYPAPGTDSGFRLETDTLGDTYAYGFARRPDFDGEEVEGVAELGWIQVDESFQGEGVGLRLLGDVLRFLAATGASRVAVRSLSEAAEGLNEKAESMGLWHLTRESEEGMEMYAIDIGPRDRTGVPVTGRELEFDADRDDVERAVGWLYDPVEIVRQTGALPTEEFPWTYIQELRPMGASGDLESEFNRQVQKYESFEDAPGTSKRGGFFFRSDAPITADKLIKTGVLPHGIDSRTWALVNAAHNYQDGPGLPEFAIVNLDRRWIMEITKPEGSDEVAMTFYSSSQGEIETHHHPSISSALEETLQFVDRGEDAEYLDLEFVDTALEQWSDDRINPAPSDRELAAEATRALAYRLRRTLWEGGRYDLQADDLTEDILRLAEKIEEGDIQPSRQMHIGQVPLIPLDELPSYTLSDLGTFLENAGFHGNVERFAEERVVPDIGPDLEAEPFDPFAEKPIEEIVRAQLPVAPDWKSTGYLAPGGTPLSLGGRGASRRDHRNIYVPDRLIPDWVDEDKNLATMLAAMEAGFIRVKPGRDLGLDMHREPTAEQKEWMRRAILSSDPPEQVIVDVKTPGENPDRDSDIFPPVPGKVTSFIDSFYGGGATSKVARFRRRNANGRVWEKMAETYPRWRPEEGESEIPARAVKWVLRGGQAIGAQGTGGEEIHHNQFVPPESVDIGGAPRWSLTQKGAARVWVNTYNSIDRVALNIDLAMPPTPSQRSTLRALIEAIGADAIIADVTDARDDNEEDGRMIEAGDAGEFLRKVKRFYSDGGFSERVERFRGGRGNPEDAAYVLAVGDDESARLQGFKPDSQRLVTMRPGRYLEVIGKHFASRPDAEPGELVTGISTDSAAVSEARVEEMADRMREEKPLDAAWLDVLTEEAFEDSDRDSPITAQEGRHRAIAARRLGLRHMPVILFLDGLAPSQFGDGTVPRAVDEEGKDLPDSITAGTTPIEWPDESTPTSELWREAKFGAPV